MTKEIQIGNKSITFTANGATALFFKQFFRKDLMELITNDDESSMMLATENIPELAFIMAKQADKADMMHLKYENYIEWLELFNPLDLTMHGEDIFMVYVADSVPSAQPKKKASAKQKE